MSQYKIVSFYKDKEYIFTYGYDNPFQQYFLERLENGKHEDYSVDLVGPYGFEGSRCVYGSAANLRHLMDRMRIWNKIPKAHQEAIMSDLSF